MKLFWSRCECFLYWFSSLFQFC